MILNIDRLKTAGVKVRCTRNGEEWELPSKAVINLYFERGEYPTELHTAIEKLLPGMQIEADILGARTVEKINDMLMVKAINDSNDNKS